MSRLLKPISQKCKNNIKKRKEKRNFFPFFLFSQLNKTHKRFCVMKKKNTFFIRLFHFTFTFCNCPYKVFYYRTGALYFVINFYLQISLFFFTIIVLFFIGAFGTFLNRRNFITMLMCIEIMLLSVNMNLFTAASILDDIAGVLLALFVMTVAAAETAIGLALCVIYHRLRSTLDVEFINLLKG